MIAVKAKSRAIGIHKPQFTPELRYRRNGHDVPQYFLLLILGIAMRLEWTGAIHLLMPIAMRSAWAAACLKQVQAPWQMT